MRRLAERGWRRSFSPRRLWQRNCLEAMLTVTVQFITAVLRIDERRRGPQESGRAMSHRYRRMVDWGVRAQR